MMEKIKQLEEYVGFPLRRKLITIEMDESHDESISYGLCQRFYMKENELKIAIKLTIDIISEFEKQKTDNSKMTEKKFFSVSDDKLPLPLKLGLLYSMLGDMYYLIGDFNRSANSFVNSLKYNSLELSHWIGFMFSLRAMGKFDIFETMIFNFTDLYNKSKTIDISKTSLLNLINDLRCKEQSDQ